VAWASEQKRLLMLAASMARALKRVVLKRMEVEKK
jgi:hypothetical protein